MEICMIYSIARFPLRWVRYVLEMYNGEMFIRFSKENVKECKNKLYSSTFIYIILFPFNRYSLNLKYRLNLLLIN